MLFVLSLSHHERILPTVNMPPLLPLLATLLASAATAQGQAPVDPALVRYIASVRAIDNHAHPMRPVANGEPADTEYDALPLDGIPPFPCRGGSRSTHRYGPRLRGRASRLWRQRDRTFRPGRSTAREST